MLQRLLEQNREAILSKWIDRTINTYKPEMVGFLKKEKNQFSNPMRNTLVTSLEKILDNILDNKVDEKCYQGLEEIIKIRAIQDFAPSQALSFVFDIKLIVREELLSGNSSGSVAKELDTFELNIDKLIRLAFDIYTKCRDKIHDIKLKEIKARTQSIFDKRKNIS